MSEHTINVDHSAKRATESVPCGDHVVSVVLVEIWNESMKNFLVTEIHWTQIFDFLHKNPANSVVGVRWASHYGSGSTGHSYAKWWHNRRTDLYQISCGAMGDTLVLQERPYHDVWCALDRGGCGHMKSECRCEAKVDAA